MSNMVVRSEWTRTLAGVRSPENLTWIKGRANATRCSGAILPANMTEIVASFVTTRKICVDRDVNVVVANVFNTGTVAAEAAPLLLRNSDSETFVGLIAAINRC